MNQRKIVADVGFLVAEIAVFVLGLSAGSVPAWVTYGLMLFTSAAVFVASVANYADGLAQGSKNVWAALKR